MNGLRIGLNIQNKARAGQERSAAEKAYLPDFLRKLNPSSIVCMDDLPFAEAMYATLPHTIVIYRQYNPAEGHLWQVINAIDYVHNQRGITKQGIPLYVMNEADSKMPTDQLAEMCKWEARVMDLFAQDGKLGVFGNEGVGHPDLTWFTDDLRWQAVKPLFDAFKRHPQMYWGLHPYWGQNGLRPQDGQSARHKDIERLLKVRGYSMPLVIFTEMGRDMYAGSQRNGWRTSGISEETYAAEIIEAQRTLWTEDYIRGACLFCFGSTEERWRAFDIEDAGVLHTALIAANQQVQAPAPPPPPPAPVDPPLPTDLGAPIHTRVSGANWRLRSAPSIDAPQIGKLIEGEEIRLYPLTTIVADGENWKVVERVIPVVSEARKGWSGYPTPAQPAEPVPLPTSPTLLEVERDMYRLVELNAQIDAAHAEINSIMAKYKPLAKVA